MLTWIHGAVSTITHSEVVYSPSCFYCHDPCIGCRTNEPWSSCWAIGGMNGCCRPNRWISRKLCMWRLPTGSTWIPYDQIHELGWEKKPVLRPNGFATKSRNNFTVIHQSTQPVVMTMSMNAMLRLERRVTMDIGPPVLSVEVALLN